MNFRHYLAVLVFFAVVVRIGGLMWTLNTVGPDVLVYGDAMGYTTLAENLINGKGFVLEQGGVVVMETFRTPALPLLLAPFTLFSNGIVLYALVLSIVAGVGLPLLTFFLARRFGIKEFPALLPASLVAFEPNLITFSWLPLTEVPFILCFLGGLLLIWSSFENEKYIRLFFGGSLLGFGVLLRPGFWPIFMLIIAISILWNIYLRKRTALISIAFVTIGLVIVLMPWFLRMHAVTGTWSLSGAGWRNVYTDYLASVRAIENKTSFSAEKELLKTVEASKLGLSRTDINNPAYSGILRDYAVAELWKHKRVVLTLEPYLLASFFTHDGYFYTLSRFGFIQKPNSIGRSASFTILSQGVSGLRGAYIELKRQYFIPLIGRAFTVSVFLFALLGAWFIRKQPSTWSFVLLIALVALTSTAIGLGVESRLRLPVEPLLFIFATIPLVRLYSLYVYRYLHPRV